MANKGFLFALLGLMLWVLPQQSQAETTQYKASELDIDFEQEAEASLKVSDPLAKFNRPMDRFNRWLLKALRPVTNTYKHNVPEGARNAIGHFFSNLTSPLNILNLGLQGKGKESLKQTGRFVFNSTVGLAGFFDVSASELNIPVHKEDFGQTLGHYGVKPGPYLNLPLLGPVMTRDLVCLPLDWSFDLDNWFFPHNPGARYGMMGIENLNKATDLQEQLILVEKNALDPYTYVRDAYWQMREAKVKE